MTTSIVALDFPSASAALAMVDRLGDRCRFYKIGNELFTSAGPEIVTRVRQTGADVFLDLKFHDIPNTVAGGVRAAASLGARLTTVHASGGSAMLAAAVSAANKTGCGVLGVTLLTSLTESEVAESWGRPPNGVNATAEVVRLAGLVAASGGHGVVCSGHEAAAVRSAFPVGLAILVPGVRPAGVGSNDQARVVTPEQATQAGATYIVLGRAVTGANDPKDAMDRINAEILSAGG